MLLQNIFLGKVGNLKPKPYHWNCMDLKRKIQPQKGKIERFSLLMRQKKPQISTYQSNEGEDKGPCKSSSVNSWIS
jgi:hypothetical protein